MDIERFVHGTIYIDLETQNIFQNFNLVCLSRGLSQKLQICQNDNTYRFSTIRLFKKIFKQNKIFILKISKKMLY